MVFCSGGHNFRCSVYTTFLFLKNMLYRTRTHEYGKSFLFVYKNHRRRVERKANVVASVWGAEFIHFLAALAGLPWSIWKKRLNSTVSAPQTDETTFAFASLSIILQ